MRILKKLDWDSQVFKQAVARIEMPRLTKAELSEALAAARTENIALVYWCSDRNDLESQQAAQNEQAILADEKTTYYKNITDTPIHDVSHIQSYNEEFPNEIMYEMAYTIGAESRFGRDAKMPLNMYKKIYRIWLENCVTRKVADEVLVAIIDGNIAGMICIQEKNGRGDIIMVAVAEGFQGQGIGKQLVHAAENYFIERGVNEMQVVTQKSNLKACALYEKCGYRIESVENFYHIWL